MEPAAREKARLRRVVRERLSSIEPEARRRRGAAALARLLSLPEVDGASAVLLFRSLPDEIDTTPAFERLLALGKTVYAPRVSPAGLAFARVDAATSWVAGGSPAAEPDSGDRWAEGSEGTVAVVPGFAFSPRGDRLGRGGGFYDRFLAGAASKGYVFAVGLALEEQVFPELPREPHDAPVDALVTDLRAVRCRPSAE